MFPPAATSPASGNPRRAPTYAVVLKAYFWDEFVARQAQRCAGQTGSGDFFLSLDETCGPHASVPYARIDRVTQPGLAALGLPNRFAERSLLWWNPDYAHYHFHEHFPGYDFYVFVEYDAIYTGHFGAIVRALAAAEVDIASIPLREPKATWYWTGPHLQTYPMDAMEGALLCVSVFSTRALGALAQRRREIATDSAITYWPSAEVFVPTEARLCGLRCASLEAFGNTTHFDWSPPYPEEVIIKGTAPFFAHPVYDRKRYIRWALAQGPALRTFASSTGPVRRALSRLPWRVWIGPWLASLLRLLLASIRARTRYLAADRTAVRQP